MNIDKITPVLWENNKVRLIDQTKLPVNYELIHCDDYKQIITAIKTMQVRGAPAIGIAGAMGVALGAQQISSENFDEFYLSLKKIADELNATRPTAVNLSWAINRMTEHAKKISEKKIDKIKKSLIEESIKIYEEDLEMSKSIGKNGSALIKDGMTILTHCNAGGLAVSGYGTALAVIYSAASQGKKIKVYADETRPLLQGARLTAFELILNDIDTTVICDNMAGWLMKNNKIDCIIVGADRIAANGDTANKIGTYSLSVLAKHHNIPMYVAAPSSTLDLSLKNGDLIPIEERNYLEVVEPFNVRIAPYDVKVYNPAFDVTPAENISAIITEKKVFFYPYQNNLSECK
ncbi:S-methyl-5-thioribose-1-phosphate isomerase [Candidatus Dependentiae bacterium]|nr:S-methyl-5-thioribose-1-phosphate isomerase [Candidatus Dependentiae bacterium]